MLGYQAIRAGGKIMLNTLIELTKGMWFKPISEFNDTVYNGAEIGKIIDLSGAEEFSSTNYNQTIEISGDHPYSCNVTEIYGQLIIYSVYDKSGLVYSADTDSIEEEIRKNKSIVIPYTIDYIKGSIKQCLQAAEKAIEENDICELAENIGQFQAYAHSLDMLLISENLGMCRDFDEQYGKINNEYMRMRYPTT
jgi:hypothetical protein